MAELKDNQVEFLRHIKGGVSLKTALQATGVSGKDLDRWMGEEIFVKEITRAAAQTRAVAEMKLLKAAPNAWLKGPGSASPPPAEPDPPQPVRCKALARNGKRCGNKATPGTAYCWRHAEEATDAEEWGPNRQAVERTLLSFGRLEDPDAARWQMLRSLASAVDDNPHRAALWTEYREALSELKKDSDNGDRSLEEAFEALRGAAEVGNTKD